MSLFDVIRLRRQAPTRRPPVGYYDLRVSKATGQVVLVDSDGTETVIAGSVTSVAGRTGAVTIASADITDATSDGATDKGKILKSGLIDGGIILGPVSCSNLGIDGRSVNLGNDVTRTYVAMTANPSGIPDSFIPPLGDPHIAGAVWNNSGALTISSG